MAKTGENLHQKPLMEELYKEELDALKKEDKNSKPKNWQLSPQAVRDFILGKKLKDGTIIKRKSFQCYSCYVAISIICMSYFYRCFFNIFKNVTI